MLSLHQFLPHLLFSCPCIFLYSPLCLGKCEMTLGEIMNQHSRDAAADTVGLEVFIALSVISLFNFLWYISLHGDNYSLTWSTCMVLIEFIVHHACNLIPPLSLNGHKHKGGGVWWNDQARIKCHPDLACYLLLPFWNNEFIPDSI